MNRQSIVLVFISFASLGLFARLALYRDTSSLVNSANSNLYIDIPHFYLPISTLVIIGVVTIIGLLSVGYKNIIPLMLSEAFAVVVWEIIMAYYSEFSLSYSDPTLWTTYWGLHGVIFVGIVFLWNVKISVSPWLFVIAGLIWVASSIVLSIHPCYYESVSVCDVPSSIYGFIARGSGYMFLMLTPFMVKSK